MKHHSLFMRFGPILPATLLLALVSGCNNDQTAENAAFRAQVAAQHQEQQSENAALRAQADTLRESIQARDVQLSELRTELSNLKVSASKQAEEVAAFRTEQAVLASRLGDLSQASDTTRERLGQLSAELEKKAKEREAQLAEQATRVYVDFQASVRLQSGQTLPVSNTEFFLLSKSLAEIAQEAGVPRANDYWSLAIMLGMDTANKVDAARLINGIAKYRVAYFKSDMDGRCEPEGLAPGRYWLFAVAKFGNSVPIWDYAVELNPGKNKLYLDNSNAASLN